MQQNGDPVLSLLESQWKLTETAKWSEFPNGGKAIVKQILATEKEINPKEQDCESYGQGSK